MLSIGEYINVCMCVLCMFMFVLCSVHASVCCMCVHFICVQLYICCTHKEIYMCCVCVLVCGSFAFFSIYAHGMKEKMCHYLQRIQPQIKQIKNNLSQSVRENVEGFSKREENLSGNHIYICIPCFRIKTKKHQTHPCHTLLTQSHILKSAGWQHLRDMPACDILRSQIAAREHSLFSYLHLKNLFFLMVNQVTNQKKLLRGK